MQRYEVILILQYVLPKIHESERKKGEKLTPAEGVLLKAYLKECNETMPDNQKIIGQETHNIFVEWGIIKE